MKVLRRVVNRSSGRCAAVAACAGGGALLFAAALAMTNWTQALVTFSVLSLLASAYKPCLTIHSKNSNFQIPLSDAVLLASVATLGVPGVAIAGVFSGIGTLVSGAEFVTIKHALIRLFFPAGAACGAAGAYSLLSSKWTMGTVLPLAASAAALMLLQLLLATKSDQDTNSKLPMDILTVTALAYPVVVLGGVAPYAMLVPSVIFYLLSLLLRDKPKQDSIAEAPREGQQPCEEVSLVDPMTGVANQRYLLMFLAQEISRSLRNGSQMSILLMDIDGLESVNNKLGLEAGDSLICDLASELRKAVREYDVVARYSGDEFVVILPETQAQPALEIAERIHHSLLEKFAAQTGINIGVATHPDHGATADDLISSAHHALNRAKFADKNNVESCHRLARAG